MRLTSALLAVALLVWAGVHAQRVASIRQQTAQAWSGDNAQFAATGFLGNHLHAYLPDGDQVRM